MIALNVDGAWVLLMLAATFMTLLAMPMVIRLAHHLGAVDQPDARKVHGQAMPRMGGLAFLLSLLVLPVSMMPLSSEMQGFLLGLAVIAATGMADDLWEISPRWKFLGLFVGSLIFVLVSDVGIKQLGDLFALGNIELGILAVPVTVVATVGFINALNLSDGLDGLAAGIALIAVFFLGCFALHAHDHLCLLLSVVLFGSMIGFLYYNSHPARVFMGDTGSLLLGYVLAAISLLLIKSHGGANTPITPVLMGTLLGLPLADTLYVMGRRVLNGTSPFQPDKTHFHHRLMQLGLTHNGVVGTMYGMMMFYGVAALVLIQTPAWVQCAALAGLIALTYGLLHCLERAGICLELPDTADETLARSSRNAFFLQMTRISGRSIPYMTWFIPATLLFPVAFMDVHGPALILAGAIILLAVVLYPWKQVRDATWSNGIHYLLVFVPILCVDLFAGQWLKDYMLWVGGLLAFWVVLKLYFRRYGRIFLSTGLEILLLMLSWVMPWLVLRLGLITEAMQASLYVASFQAVVYLLATKIVLRHQPRRNRILLLSLLTVNILLFV